MLSRVNIYGDSIMRGTVIDEGRRYHTTVARHISYLAQRFGLYFKNRAHFGLTIDRGHKLLTHDIQKGLNCSFAVIEYGGNDCSFLWNEVALHPQNNHYPLTSIEEFQSHCEEMALEVSACGAVPVLMTLPPIDAVRHLRFVGNGSEERKNILKWLGDVQIIYRVHEKYSRAIERVAQKTQAVLVDVRNRFLDRHDLGALIGMDGVHLTEAGYALVAEAFADFVEARRRDPGRRVFE